MCQSLRKRTAEEEQRGNHHHVAPPKKVRKSAGEESADEAADQQGSDGEAEAAVAELEGCSKSFLCPVYRSQAVIAEQGPADCHRDDRSNETHVRAVSTRFDHLLSPSCASGD